MALTTTPSELTATALTLTTAAQPNITSVGTLTALTGGTGDLIWDTNTLVVDSSTDRVGIGTTSPSFDLEINKASAAAAVLINSGNNDAMLRLYTANNVGKWRVIATTSDDNLSIQNLNSGASAFNNRMTFTDGGNVGIGSAAPTSGAGWAKFLHIASGSSNALILDGTDSQQGSIGAVDGLYIDSTGHTTSTNNNIIFRTQSANSNYNGVERMRISSTGTTTITGPAAATFTVKSTDGAGSTPGPHIILRRDSASPADGDDVGELQWIGKNNAAEDVTLAMMRTWNRSVTDGSEGSSFGLYDRQGGTQTGI